MKVGGVWSHKASGLSSRHPQAAQVRTCSGTTELCPWPPPPLLPWNCFAQTQLSHEVAVRWGWGWLATSEPGREVVLGRRVLTAVPLTTRHLPKEDAWRAGVGLSGKAVFSPFEQLFHFDLMPTANQRKRLSLGLLESCQISSLSHINSPALARHINVPEIRNALQSLFSLGDPHKWTQVYGQKF